ncbi:hypothetical protein [Massilia sp. Leaf139]|uniref:hypothetical protein n=1 Tax=Massilia sp. Leaf139 TaxID=1736272 RepID=UPI0006FE5934|nr:hypothetical protein [Massilia sp. Leaf139]KQQ97302.1 hypothetical protein ASF77_04950 [Massilia sp. Leaf139]
MNYPDDILMAYADGALAEPLRSEVERAVRADPALAAIVEQHRARRRAIVAGEPGPARPQPAATGKVLSLEAARSARARVAAPPPAPAPAAPSAWPRWGALTAALVLGVLAGSFWFDGSSGEGSMVTAQADGRLVARGQLAGALARQLATDPAPTSPVRIGVSFATRAGGYCRSFSIGASTGLACRDGETWRIPVLSEAKAARGEARPAAGVTPVAVLDAIDERIAGTPLNAAAERAARDRGWKR